MHAVMASTSTPSCSPSSTVPTPSFKDHLSYPSVIDPEPTSEQQQPQQPRQLLKDRLYIGNLHPTVDESVPPLPLHPSNLIIPLQKVLTPSSLFKVWQGFQARFSLPQDRAPQRQAPRICIYRVRKQRCKCLSHPPSFPPRLSCVMPALRTLLLTLAFPFPITHRMNRPFLKSAIDAVQSPGIRVPVTQPRPVLSCRERKEEADHIALNVGRNEGFNTGP